jgi:transcriptional regulator with XRE-family HTH domain
MSERNELIGKTLKESRKSLNLKVPEVSKILKQNYGMDVAAKTIYGWESNQCYPPTNKLIALCEIYRINNIGKSFSQKTSDDFRITPYERMVIQGLRENPEMRMAIDRLLKIEERLIQ